MATVPFSKLTGSTLRDAVRQSIKESRVSSEEKTSNDVITTVLEGREGDEIHIQYSPSREILVLAAKENGKLVAKDRVRNASLAAYRHQIRYRIKWGMKVVTTSEADLKDYTRPSFTQTLKSRAYIMGGEALMNSVVEGFHKLVRDEPERFSKLYESVDKGRLDDVIRSLDAYAKN